MSIPARTGWDTGYREAKFLTQRDSMIVVCSGNGPEFGRIECPYRRCSLNDRLNRIADGIDPLLVISQNTPGRSLYTPSSRHPKSPGKVFYLGSE